MTPEQRYICDPTFNHVVQCMENIIHEAQLTPSEIREAATLACIHYEMRNATPYLVHPGKVMAALKTLEDYRKKQMEDISS